jgi:hypothetical protein
MWLQFPAHFALAAEAKACGAAVDSFHRIHLLISDHDTINAILIILVVKAKTVPQFMNRNF